MIEKYDVVVIGLGPNGLTILDSLHRANLSVLGLDKGEVLSNIKKLPKWFQFASSGWIMLGIDNPGNGDDAYENPTIAEFIKYYEDFAKNINCKKITNANIYKISGEDLNYEISYKKNNETITIYSKKIVCSTGLYSAPRKLNVPNEIQNNILSHMPEDNEELKKLDDIPTNERNKYRDGNGFAELYPTFKNKRVVIIGGGNSSAMTFLNLYKYNKVYWLSRGKIGKKVSYRWIDKINKQKNNPNVEFIENIKITRFGKSCIYFRDTKGEHSITFDICYKLIGYEPINNLISNILKLPMGSSKQSYVKINDALLKSKKQNNINEFNNEYSQTVSYPCYNLFTMESVRKGIYLFGASTCQAQYFNTKQNKKVCKSVFMYDCKFIAKNVVEHIHKSLQ